MPAATPASHVFDADWLVAASAGLDAVGSALIAQAVHWAQAQWTQSEPLFATPAESFAQHGAGVARILADLHADADTRAAGILAAAPDGMVTIDSLASNFGSDVARLVQGAHALTRLGATTRASSDSVAASGEQKEMLRKMVLAMASDLRIVLIRLASRLQTLRWHASHKTTGAPTCTPTFARESLDLYAPLANRLGIWQLKWEIEDLAFRFLEPERYRHIARLLEEKRGERETFIAAVVARVAEALAQAGIAAEVSGRPKHIYSIWNKMRIKSLDFAQLYDLRAVRVIVPDVRACYTALALVHEFWTPLIDEFDDYISRPKPNGYRSLHTVLRDASGRSFEVQIRTREMHHFAEYGMAAHWRYKEAGAQGGQVTATSSYDRQLAWLRQLLAWQRDVDAGDSPGAPHHGSAERIYVLTPQARVIELPAGATPVDFAYHLHTDLGHRCRGAKVDGQLVSLHTPLATGQTVEITAAKSGGPSRDWLNPNLGFLASPRARAKVRAWFNAVELQQRITQGQALVEKALQRLGKTAVNLEWLAQQLGFARPDDLYVAVAKDEFSLRHLDAVFAPTAHQSTAPVDPLRPRAQRPHPAEKRVDAGRGVLVVGVDSLLTQLARCCRPAPPDAISGFVTRGRGVSIHRADCASLAALRRDQPERIIDVTWGDTQDARYPVDLEVHASDRPGLLRDISEVFARLRVNVIGVHTQSRQSLAHMVFTAEVHDAREAAKALAALAEVAGVVSARRR